MPIIIIIEKVRYILYNIWKIINKIEPRNFMINPFRSKPAFYYCYPTHAPAHVRYRMKCDGNFIGLIKCFVYNIIV